MRGVLIFMLMFAKTAAAAVGCDLNDPDRDVARFFKGYDSYKTEYMSIKEKGGEVLLEVVENRLGDRFKGIFETIDVPYTIYTVLKDGRVMGYIHGANQKGVYGGMQVFLVFDKNGTVTDLYYQKLTSKAAKVLKSRENVDQFKGVTLNNFDGKKFISPGPEADEDFKYTLRGVKKNLILMDVFVLNPWEGGRK